MKSTLVRPSDSASVDPLLGVPYRLQVAASVTRYQSCTVDPRPGRVVHCPDLNACLVNEGRTQPVDCNAVHYGYAIPVNVVPIQDDPNLAELVLDTETDLTPETVSYLINHHPQLRGGTEKKSEMATTANHRGGKFSEPEEDIAAIAKQISDHAEAIYQTWKSRGLAPTEILNCHSNVTAADKFGSVLTPQPTPSTASPVVDLLSATPTSMNTNNLEQLVNNFVVEDKARLARQQKQSSGQGKNLPSSIQFALQKFEKKTEPPVKTFQKPIPVVRQNEQVLKIYPNAPKINYSQPKTTKNISPFIMDTIETTFPEDFNPSKVVMPTPVKTEDSGSGLTTWPLKTKTIVADTVKKLEPKPVVDNGKYATLPTKTATANEYLDEVDKEEERLINALKTGIIIAEDPNSKRNAGKKTSGLLQKKNNVKDKTQIVTNPEPSIVSSKASELDVVDYGNSLIVRDDKPNVAKVLNKIEPPSTRRTPNVRTSCSPVPHPELTGAQRNHIRTAAANGLANHVGNPVRPFLTRGSVAERVLIFEKCPTELMEKRAKSSAATGLSSWRTAGTDVQSRAQNGSDLDGPGSPKFPYKPWKHPRPRSYNKNYSRESLSSQKSTGPPPHTTLQRHTKANRSLLIPRFHYPQGKPSNQTQLEVTLEAVRQVFQTFPNQQVTRDKFSAITKAAGCPLYWKAPLFIACGGEKLGYVELNTFLDYWRNLCTMCHDNASRFMRILTRSTTRNYLLPEDLMSLVQDVVDTHPGLTFLKEAAEFHSRYVHTVISRIYYCVNQSWSGQITLPELRKSDFLRVVQLLETEDDINQVTQYFSYEHFYVIYCKFWELDRDHDLFIDKNDLARHSDHALSTRLIHRIFSGTVTRGKTSNGQQSQLNGTPDAKMSYTEFVWFLLAEEDKQHPRAIEYWFRCMDLDGDGYLSMYELEYFYDEQLQRMEAIGIECLPFEDCLCQMLDMIRPAIPGKISLTDLKKCKMTPIFFDTFFNLEKYLDHEQRDPFASQRDHDTEMSDWDRYAAEEYELLVAEEGGNDNQEEFGDEDGEGEDALSPNLDHILSSHTFTNNNTEGGGNKPRPKRDWSQPQPSLTVTDFDDQDESSSDSADYAADSDDCSM